MSFAERSYINRRYKLAALVVLGVELFGRFGNGDIDLIDQVAASIIEKTLHPYQRL